MILNSNRHAFDVCLIHLAWRAKKNESGSSSHDGGIALAVRYATGWAKCDMKSPGSGANEFLRLVCKSVMPIIWNYSEPISIANSFHATPDKKKKWKNSTCASCWRYRLFDVVFNSINAKTLHTLLFFSSIILHFFAKCSTAYLTRLSMNLPHLSWHR